MPTAEERLASLDARMDRIDDLFMLVDHLRSDMSDLRSDLKELRSEMNEQFTEVRAEAHRDFRWAVGIQLTTMAAVIGALIGVLYRQ